MTPGSWLASSMMKPTIPSRLIKMLHHPLRPVRSAYQPTRIVRIAAAAYGGTDSKFAVVLVYPSSLMMVGRNRLNAYSAPSQPMYTIAKAHVFQSFTDAQKYFI